MKAKILLAWRILVAAGMVAILFIAGLIAYKLCEEYYTYRKDETYTRSTYYSDSYVYEYKKGSVRLKEVKSGKYLTPKLDRIFDGNVRDSLTVFFQGDKRGFLNVYTGQIVLPARYDRAWVFSEGLGAVVKDGQLSFINHKGETMIQLHSGYRDRWQDRIDFLFKNGYCTVYDSSGKHGLIDKTGAWVIEPQYDCINNPVSGFRIVKEGNKYGLLGIALQWVLPIEYDWISLRKEGIIVYKNDVQQLLAFDGKTVLQPIVYDGIYYLTYRTDQMDAENNIINAKSDYLAYQVWNKWGIMDKNGRVITRATYDKVDALNNDLFKCTVSHGRHVVINSKGEVVQ